MIITSIINKQLSEEKQKKPNQQHFDENFFEKMKKKMFLYFSTSSL